MHNALCWSFLLSQFNTDTKNSIKTNTMKQIRPSAISLNCHHKFFNVKHFYFLSIVLFFYLYYPFFALAINQNDFNEKNCRRKVHSFPRRTSNFGFLWSIELDKTNTSTLNNNIITTENNIMNNVSNFAKQPQCNIWEISRKHHKLLRSSAKSKREREKIDHKTRNLSENTFY